MFLGSILLYIIQLISHRKLMVSLSRIDELYVYFEYIHKRVMLMARAQTNHKFTFELPVNETSAIRVSFDIA